MQKHIHEMHEDISEKFPIIFHTTVLNESATCYPNWHENIEILCVTGGEVEVTVDSVNFKAAKNDTVVINSDSFHIVRAINGVASYYCLIIDKEFCKSFGFDTTSDFLREKISDTDILMIFKKIAEEIENKNNYYESAVKYLVCELLVKMYREYYVSAEVSSYNSGKSEIVKRAAKYIGKNYARNLNIGEIADAVNVSKYYLCRIFKEVVGITMIEYANFTRCKKANRLISAGNMSISDIAEKCGFENMSYFSKIYKKYMNILPSEQRKIRKVSEQ
ncbi:MAG: helix-turn-helix transcriptional regulator [Clostridia bacterium]|nr:helix-turn-helix transcriptional regulator [Clostridia bacterium]